MFDPRDSAYAVNLTYDRHIYIPTYISREISIEHPSVGLASLAQKLYILYHCSMSFSVSILVHMSHINMLYIPFNVISTFRTFGFGLVWSISSLMSRFFKSQVEKKRSYSYDFLSHL